MAVKKTLSAITSSASLQHRRQVSELSVRRGTIGPNVVDVANLYQETGCFTYDPGFTSTANCSSKITYIDGDKGELLYRGYPIEQLAESSDACQHVAIIDESGNNGRFVFLYIEKPKRLRHDI